MKNYYRYYNLRYFFDKRKHYLKKYNITIYSIMSPNKLWLLLDILSDKSRKEIKKKSDKK